MIDTQSLPPEDLRQLLPSQVYMDTHHLPSETPWKTSCPLSTTWHSAMMSLLQQKKSLLIPGLLKRLKSSGQNHGKERWGGQPLRSDLAKVRMMTLTTIAATRAKKDQPIKLETQNHRTCQATWNEWSSDSGACTKLKRSKKTKWVHLLYPHPKVMAISPGPCHQWAGEATFLKGKLQTGSFATASQHTN